MGELYESGQIALIVLGFIAMEAVALSILFARRGRGAQVAGLLANLAAGALLVAAAGAALAGSGWQVVAGALALSFVAHVFDVAARWRA
jgi:hypothetical protein